MKSGIYSITNTINGRRYIGSASQLASRWGRHRFDLRNAVHSNKILERSWKKNGEESFVFEVLEFCEKTDLIEREQVWLDKTWPDGLFNIRLVAHSGAGLKHTDDAKRKMSIASKSARAEPSLKMISKLATHGEKLRGKTHSAETRRRMSEAHIGVASSDEARENMSKAALCRSREHIDQINAANAQNWLVTKPDGEVILVTNLARFAAENELSQSHLYGVAAGRRKHHRGFTVSKASDYESTDADPALFCYNARTTNQVKNVDHGVVCGN